MTDEERQDAALKIYKIVSPCLKRKAGTKAISPLYETKRGMKTETGVLSLMADLIKNPYQEE
jgi:hypothetical protein